jgi:glycosyltransferase involved in cell wall biosynthesis
MQEIKGLVSVIIPVYNGEKYLAETLESIKAQSYSHWEIIIVNDGSTDRTSAITEKENDYRIRSILQDNSGVSAARNNGLRNARGEYVIFFDADDLMTFFFIEIRVNALTNEESIGFVGGPVETFPEKSIVRKAIANDPEREIFFFDPGSVSVPSNYLFRKEVLIKNNIWFNTSLGSTADRFFLLQLARVTIGRSLDNNEAKLLYRINPLSMSHKVSASLILDNENFYHELLKKNMLPAQNITEFKSRYFYSLAGGFIKIKKFNRSLIYLGKSFFASPICFMKVIAGRTFRGFQKQ